MDWIDPKYAKQTKSATKTSRKTDSKSKRKKVSSEPQSRKVETTLQAQVSLALSHPTQLWSTAYGQALSRVVWPKDCKMESTFLWSSLIQEQAEVLVRAGFPASKLAPLVSEKPDSTEEERAEQIADVLGLMDRPLENQATEWLEQIDTYPYAAFGVSALLWKAADVARSGDQAWLPDWLKAASHAIDASELEESECVLARLVLRCEAPLLLALATSTTPRTSLQAANQAMDFLAEYLESGGESPDTWLKHGATYLRASLACVLRCRLLADTLGLRAWYPAQRKALVELLIHAARWSRPNGSQLLASDATLSKSNGIWGALASLTRNPKRLLAAMTLSGLGPGKRSEIKDNFSSLKLPALSHYSENAECAAVQTDWKHKGSRIAIDYSDSPLCIEALGAKGLPILSGDGLVEVEVDGVLQAAPREWLEVCWFSDDDVDYLELEAQLDHGLRVQRQIALFREERMLYLADALLAESVSDLTLRSTLPLASFTTFEPTEKTTEGFIVTPSTRSLVLPLFLPEWKRQLSINQSQDSLVQVGEDLQAQATAHGKRVYNPVLISLCSSHAKQPYTWRHLTVADELRIVDRDEAQAYRVQIGSEQWFIYRNLAEPVRRTALSLHTMDDFFAARFDPEDGEFETIVQVEPPESE